MAFGRQEIEDKARRILGEEGPRAVELALSACEDGEARRRMRTEMGWS
jgi:hypothetical protein